MDQHLLSFIVRWIHVVSMALLLGGGIPVLLFALDSKKPGQPSLLAALVAKYESVFWFAIGIQVITGIGNLGSFGAGLPDVHSLWGAKLLVKLVVVTLFVGFSLVRTLLTTRLGFCINSMPAARSAKTYEGVYGISALLLVAIVLMAEALAHG